MNTQCRVKYCNPANVPGVDVCPHCKQETQIFLTTHDGVPVETHRCRAHGDVTPMRSAVVNREWPDWSAA